MPLSTHTPPKKPDTPLAELLHPLVASWSTGRFGAFTDAQSRCVPHVLDGESVLLSSPTGSGKTLAGFLGVIDQLVREHVAGTLTDSVRAIYISPLRALTYDIQKNLSEPLAEMGLGDTVRVALRTGDTTATERAKFKKRPPHIFLTTPESLAIVLCQEAYRVAFATCRTVIIDELHALAENKRGIHLAVSLERLEALVAPRRMARVGLSATIAPLDDVARFLVGTPSERHCHIVEAAPGSESIVEVLSPLRRDPYPPAGWTAVRIIEDIARTVDARATTIIFTNTRSGAENISHRLKSALPRLAHCIETHHSSLDRDIRVEVEDRLKNGELRAVVCSTSLELGIDIGSVDTVVMVSTPKGISRTLQRIGRSGHSIHQRSHGVLCATNINDLVECVVCAAMTKRGRLDPVSLPGAAADVAAQHIVGMAISDGVTRDEAFQTLLRAHPFREMSRTVFDRLIAYLKGGGRSLESQYSHTFGKIVESGPDGLLEVPSKKVVRDYLVNVGTIHAEGMVQVYLGTRRRKLGEVEEGFIKGMRTGDTFVLAGRTVKLVETGVTEAFVEYSGGLPSVPSWNANKMPLASGLAREVTAFRTELNRLLDHPDTEGDAAVDRLVEEWMISTTNATAIVRHFETQRAVSRIPVDRLMLVERYHGQGAEAEAEADDKLHYFFHTLIGRKANDALSRIVAQRLKDAVGGNAMATIDDYGFLLTVRTFQELGADEWKDLFSPEGAEEALDRSLSKSELVKWQFRGVAQTGLMVPRNLPGKERRLRQLRWSAEILFRVLGEREPDHPLLAEAYRESKHTFLDTRNALTFLHDVQDFEWDTIDVDVVTPFSFGIYASKIKEGMMLEDPETAIERIYHQLASNLPRFDPNPLA